MSETNGNPEAEARFSDALKMFDACSNMEFQEDLPPEIGNHNATVNVLRITTNSKTGTPMIVLEMTVDKGASKGRKAVKFYTLDDSKDSQMKMLFWDLNAIGQDVPSLKNKHGITKFDWGTWIRGLTNILPCNVKDAESRSVEITVKPNSNPTFGPNIWIKNANRFKRAA